MSCLEWSGRGDLNARTLRPRRYLGVSTEEEARLLDAVEKARSRPERPMNATPQRREDRTREKPGGVLQRLIHSPHNARC